MNPLDSLIAAGKVLKEANKIEQYQQILEAQQELLVIQKRLQELEKENGELKDKLMIKERLIVENGVYWINSEKKDGPFCTRCWDKEKNLIRMRVHDRTPGFKASFDCPECENRFYYGEPGQIQKQIKRQPYL